MFILLFFSLPKLCYCTLLRLSVFPLWNDRQPQHHFNPCSHVPTKAKVSLCALSVASPAKKPELAPHNAALHLTLQPAATHSKVRLYNMHFNAVLKLMGIFLLFCSVLLLKGAAAGDVTWFTNKFYQHTITHLFMFHFVTFIDVPDEVWCPLRVKSWDNQSARRLLI